MVENNKEWLEKHYPATAMYIADLKAQLASRQELIDLDAGLLHSQREEIDRLENQLAVQEQECERLRADLGTCRKLRENECEEYHEREEKLRAEVERRKLKWQTGSPPVEAMYLFRDSRNPEDTIFTHLSPGAGYEWDQWAGPIEPPEE